VLTPDGIYGRLFRVFRPGRLRLLYAVFRIAPSTRVLDLGGGAYWWELARQENLPSPEVTIVNLHAPLGPLPPSVRWLVADGRRLPFHDGAFDLAFCNSVIENMGAWEHQRQLAAEIRRVAEQRFAQTPDRRFPLEPHYLAPLIHWLPKAARLRLIRRFTLRGLLARPSENERRTFVAELRLLSVLRRRFPALKTAYTFSPPFRPLTPNEDEEVVCQINASGARTLFVGLSTPKQEYWMAAHLGYNSSGCAVSQIPRNAIPATPSLSQTSLTTTAPMTLRDKSLRSQAVQRSTEQLHLRPQTRVEAHVT
jgi:hypothetical protein